MNLSMVRTWAGVSLCAASLLACESQADRKAEAVQEAQEERHETAQEVQKDQAELARDQAEQRMDTARDQAQEAQKVRGDEAEDRQDLVKDQTKEQIDLTKDQIKDSQDKQAAAVKDQVEADKDLSKAEIEFAAARRKYVLDARQRLGEIQNRADSLKTTEHTSEIAGFPASVEKARADITALETTPAADFKRAKRDMENYLDKLEKSVKSADK